MFSSDLDSDVYDAQYDVFVYKLNWTVEGAFTRQLIECLSPCQDFQRLSCLHPKGTWGQKQLPVLDCRHVFLGRFAIKGALTAVHSLPAVHYLFICCSFDVNAVNDLTIFC